MWPSQGLRLKNYKERYCVPREIPIPFDRNTRAAVVDAFIPGATGGRRLAEAAALQYRPVSRRTEPRLFNETGYADAIPFKGDPDTK